MLTWRSGSITYWKDGSVLRESCPDGLWESLGTHRTDQKPRAHLSREQWRSWISLALRLSFKQNFFQTFCIYLLSPLSLFIVTSEAMICTQGIRRRATAAAPRASAKIQVLSLLVWDCPWPNPPYATGTAAEGIARFRVEEGHLCIWAWGGTIGQSCWRGRSCSLPLTLVLGRQARWGVAGGAEGGAPPGGRGAGRLGRTELAEAQKGRNRSHRLWTWEKNRHQ